MEEEYKALAERNGWDYSLIDNRPYFMKNGNYAIPDETTSEEDKELLASIISEGSDEMAKLIITCWDNGVGISGPCSGIREFHDEPPIYLHFAFIGDKELIDSLNQDLQEIYPSFDHHLREKNDNVRYDINYSLEGKDLSKKEADLVFSTMRQELTKELNISKSKKH